MASIIILTPPIRDTGPVSPTSYRGCLAEGLKKLDVDVHLFPGYGRLPQCKYVACWGWRKGRELRPRGYEILVMERGYIGDRFKYTSIGWNGLNNYAEFPEYPDDGGERFASHGGIIKPWKKDGKYALILGQVKGDASLKGRDISGWYEQTANAIREHYNIPVYFRPHPKALAGYHSVKGVSNIGGDLKDALDGALFTVAYNSNSCLDSVLAGVPCYAGDEGTLAYDLCMKDIKEIIYPEREKIAHQIAWKQWTAEEISSGYALKKIIERMV